MPVGVYKRYEGIKCGFQKGHEVPQEWREKWRQKFKGRKLSPETIAKLKGRIAWNKGKKGLQVAWNKGISAPWAKNLPQRFEKGLIPWNKDKPYDAIRGKKNPNWKGGISSENVKLRMSILGRRWRERVFKRDSFFCLNCGQWGRKLNAHHIYSWTDYPELRFDIDNGVTLCEACHYK